MFGFLRQGLTLLGAGLFLFCAAASQAAPVRIAVIAFALPSDNAAIAEATKKALSPLFSERGRNRSSSGTSAGRRGRRHGRAFFELNSR